MNKQFSLYPKIAVLVILMGLLAQKIYVAFSGFKAGQKTEMVKTIDGYPMATITHSQTDVVAHPGDTDLLPENSKHAIEPNSKPAPNTYKNTEWRALNAQVPDSTDTGDSSTSSLSAIDFIRQNFVTLIWALVALVEVIVRLTPTQKDNSILSFITEWLSKLLPNRRAGGGSF